MKKFLAIFLALMTAATVSLAACSKENNKNNDDDEWDEPSFDEPANTTDSASDDTADTSDGTDTGSSNNNNNNSTTGQWINKADKVYIGIDNTNLREGPGKSYKVGKTLRAGVELERVSTNGAWDKVMYDGVEYYVDADLVTTDGKDFAFTNVETPLLLTVKTGYQINLRTSPFYNEEYKDQNVGVSGLKPENTTDSAEATTNLLKKIAVSESGDWYKVTYTGSVNGETLTDATFYIAASNVADGYVIDPSNPPVSGGNSGSTVG